MQLVGPHPQNDKHTKQIKFFAVDQMLKILVINSNGENGHLPVMKKKSEKEKQLLTQEKQHT